jgi:AcrR family transcriptional regulator
MAARVPRSDQQPKQQPKQKRVRRDPEQARALILDAAVRVISKQGPHAVGLKDVAAEAGVSHALITHYFKTYESLVEAAVDTTMARLRERLIDAALSRGATPSPAAMLELYLEVASEPWYGRLASWALFADHDKDGSIAGRAAPEMQLLVAATEQVLSARMKPPPTRAQVEAILVAVWSLGVGYAGGNAFFWRALGRKPSPRKDRELRDALGAFARSLFGE